MRHLPEEHVPRRAPTEDSGGGGKVRYPAEHIHAAGTSIAGTAGRIREVGQQVGNVSIDSRSFGALNEEFATTAQQHVLTAQRHVEKTAKEVDAAADATHATANNYQATEQSNAKLFTDIQNNEASPITPAGPSGKAPPPPEPSWRDTINDPKNFTPDEQAKIHDALHKMAQDPEPGKVAGAGALTPEQRQLMARVQKLVTIEADTPMQKAMPQGSANDYLSNVTRTKAVDGYVFDPNRVGGFVARQQDGMGLHSNGEVIQGNRLDYPGTRFNLADPNEPVYVMKFPADDPTRYQTPLGAPFSNDPGMLGEFHPDVQATAADMTAAAVGAGIDPTEFHEQVSPWPYSGIGVTADEHLGLPERQMSGGRIPPGAEMYANDQYGNQVLVGRYNAVARRWVDLRPSSTP